MRLETVSLDLLVPIETSLRNESVVKSMFSYFDKRLFRPILVIDYQRDGQDVFLMGDGHHRAVYCYLNGIPANIKVLETDREVYGCALGADYVSEFVSNYEEHYKQSCDHFGIHSIEDLARRQAELSPEGIVAQKLRKLAA
jgi:hypothetical protein